MRIWVQKSASMQKRTSPLKFGDLAEKSGLNSVSNLSTKVQALRTHPKCLDVQCYALGVLSACLSCWWRPVRHQILMNWWICSSKIDELLHHFLANFEKLVQKIVTSGNCLQFPEIPEEIRENFTEKSAISVKFQQHFEKILQKSPTSAKIWKFWNVSGAKVCLSCRAWKML